MRYDVLILNSGTVVGDIRARLKLLEAAAEPITLVRRQDIGIATWHRLSFDELVDAIALAEEDDVLSALVTLDIANEVPVVLLEQLRRGEDPYGVHMLGTEAIGFSEGSLEQFAAPTRGPTRGSGPAAPSDTLGLAAAASAENATGNTGSRATMKTDESAAIRFGAFPVIEAPKTVDPDETFEVAVGVNEAALRHTVAERIEVTDLDPYTQTIRFQVMLNSPFFDIVGGSDQLHELKLNRKTLAHTPVVFSATPADPPGSYDPQVGVWTARLTATFFYEDTIVGEGYREIRVNQGRTRPAAKRSNHEPVGEASLPVAMSEDTDLTITIEHEDPMGNYTVRVFSPHLARPVVGRIALGQDPTHFAAQVVEHVESSHETEVADETMEFVGKRVARKVPEEVKAAIKDVWDTLNGPDVVEAERRIPDVLILTDDWAVPWELMKIELDASKPPFLGAQVNVGRWPNQYRDRLESGPVGVNALGVMVGHYPEKANLHPRLKEAEAEGQELVERYRAKMVDADTKALDHLLKGRLADGFEFEALHFAAHGQKHTDGGAYLVYSNGKRMDTWALGAASVAEDKSAFVFVNACQVGTAEQMLGEYSGVAGAAIEAGFRGFVAPLWSIADDVAKEISLGLYEASARGESISSYLRKVRARFVQTPQKVAHTTNMAYVFYGHPRLQLGGPVRRQP